MNRPLNERQVIYAATDAYCLLQIYSKIENNFKNSSYCANNTSLIEFYKDYVSDNNWKKHRKRKKKELRKRK